MSLKLNGDVAKRSPNLTPMKEPPPDADLFNGMAGKFEAHFSSAPGQGD